MMANLATNSIMPNLLMHLLSLHECKVVIHVQNENKTQLDYSFITHIEHDLNVPFLVQDLSIDMSDETSIFGKACITSFSEAGLDQVSFVFRRKRPTKILLGNISTFSYPKLAYEPIIVENAPIISLIETSLSSSMHSIY